MLIITILPTFLKNTKNVTDNHPGICEGENELEVQTFDLWEDFSSISGYLNKKRGSTNREVDPWPKAYFNVKPANKTKI